MSLESQPTTSRDDAYFLESIFFKVEGTIFKVPRYQFDANEVFSTTFTLPPVDGADAEGSSEKKPFELLGITSEDFRAFLRALYPLNPLGHANMYPGPEALTPKEWLSVLTLSDMWGFQSFKDFAIKKLGLLNDMEPVDKMLLGKKYDMPHWFVNGCIDLINRDKGPQPNEISKMGLQAAVNVYELREKRLSRLLGDIKSEIQKKFGDVAGRVAQTGAQSVLGWPR